MHDTNTQDVQKHSKTKAKIAVLSAVFVAGVGNQFVFAVLAPLGREMGLLDSQIGPIITVSAIVFMIGAPIWGARSEVWGRKPIIQFAMVAYCITTLLFAIVAQLRLEAVLSIGVAYTLLIFFRVLFTAGISGVFPSTQAYMADITSLEDRTVGMSLIGIAMGLGMMFGPALAAALSGFGLVVPFYGVALLSIPAGLMVSAWIHEDHHERHARNQETGKLPFAEVLPFFVISTCVMMSLSTIQMATGFYIQDKFELSAQATGRAMGIALMVSSIMSVAAQLVLVQRLRLRPRTLLRSGVLFALTSIVILQIADAYWGIVVGMGFFGLAMGQMMPGTISSLSIKAGLNHQGRVAGLNASFQGLGFIVGPLIGSVLYAVSPLLPYRICTGLLVVLFLNVYFVAHYPD